MSSDEESISGEEATSEEEEVEQQVVIKKKRKVKKKVRRQDLPVHLLLPMCSVRYIDMHFFMAFCPLQRELSDAEAHYEYTS